MQTFQGKKALVIGAGISGRSVARFLVDNGSIVWCVDRDRALLNENPEVHALHKCGVQFVHESDPINLLSFDGIVVSPGIAQTHPLYSKARELKLPLWGEVELACFVLHKRNQPKRFLGVTGTNGKTTVTLLVTHVLNFSGKKARAVGNVGKPIVDLLAAPNESWDVAVIELSSYQLETLVTPILDAAVVLNITPDHLDRYSSMEEYAKAKMSILRCLRPKAPLYVEDISFRTFGNLLFGFPAYTYGYRMGCTLRWEQCSLYCGEKKLLSLEQYRGIDVSHDIENIMAAFALCSELGITSNEFQSALASFRKPHHRIEFVENINGVNYYDDSKGTNIDAVIRAVQSLNGQIILIAGGVDKGSSYLPWVEAFAKRVRCIYAIGEAAKKIQKELSAYIPVVLCDSLDEAVRNASDIAKPGETVLLSPGCSSFDMFRDYVHRGETFQQIVRSRGRI